MLTKLRLVVDRKRYIEGQLSPRRFLEELTPDSPYILFKVIDDIDTFRSKVYVSILTSHKITYKYIEESGNLHDIVKASLFSIINIGKMDAFVGNKSKNNSFVGVQRTMHTTHQYKLFSSSTFYHPLHITINSLSEERFEGKFGFNKGGKHCDSGCRICELPAETCTTLTGCGHFFCDDC